MFNSMFLMILLQTPSDESSPQSKHEGEAVTLYINVSVSLGDQ